MNSTVLGRSEVVHVLLSVGREVNRQTTSVNEGHTTTFLLDVSASIHILLVGVGLTLQLHELGVFETFT